MAWLREKGKDEAENAYKVLRKCASQGISFPGIGVLSVEEIEHAIEEYERERSVQNSLSASESIEHAIEEYERERSVQNSLSALESGEDEESESASEYQSGEDTSDEEVPTRPSLA